MSKFCPFVNGECKEHGCVFYINLLGKNPQTGLDQNEWGCTFSFLPVLLIENTQSNRQINATVQEFRTESNAHNNAVGTTMAALSHIARQVNGNDDHKRIIARVEDSRGDILPGQSG